MHLCFNLVKLRGMAIQVMFMRSGISFVREPLEFGDEVVRAAPRLPQVHRGPDVPSSCTTTRLPRKARGRVSRAAHFPRLNITRFHLYFYFHTAASFCPVSNRMGSSFSQPLDTNAEENALVGRAPLTPLSSACHLY